MIDAADRDGAGKESKKPGSMDCAKGLELIRYLFSLGVEQSRQAEPTNSASLLWFHRAVEAFLELAAEQVGVSDKARTFGERWNAVSSKLGRPLSRQESMRAMDGAAARLRRHGTPHSPADVESFRASVAGFLRENAPLVFGVEFGRELLVDSVRYAKVRERLRSAQDCMENDDPEGAMKEISAAFYILFHEYMVGIKTMRRTSKKQLIAVLNKKAEIMHKALDWEKYKEFRRTAPLVMLFFNECVVAGAGNCNMEDCAFYFNFVIESAVSFQDLGHV